MVMGHYLKTYTVGVYSRSFPGSNIKQVKAFIYEFVTKNDNKAEMFKNIKSLAKTEEQWRFSTTTDFTTNENNEVVVCRSFNLYTGRL